MKKLPHAMVVLVASVVLGVVASPAAGKVERVQRAGVGASFAYAKHRDFPYYSDLRLRITHGRRVMHDGPVTSRYCDAVCWPGIASKPSLQLADLDGDRRPEVVLDLYSGGAHCCFIGQVWRYDGRRYRASEHLFDNPDYRLRDLGRDGRVEFETRDDAFSYLFTSYADSVAPVQIWRVTAGRFIDVTRAFPASIRSDARRTLRLYQNARREGRDARGAAAAWAADEYLLGRRRPALAYLRREGRQGRLGRDADRFIRQLDRVLRRLGYA